MEVHARAPDPLSNKGDMAKNWHRWKEDFVIFMKVTGYINKPDQDRANILKNRIGKIGIDAIEDISFDNPQDRDNMDILIRKLEEYFDPPKNEIVERYSFFTMKKKQNESIEQYINDLRVRFFHSRDALSSLRLILYYRTFYIAHWILHIAIR